MEEKFVPLKGELYQEINIIKVYTQSYSYI